MAHESNFKNILFDLGGVILDLNVNGTLESFLKLGFPKELLSYPENFYTDIFYNYETGKVSTSGFRDSIRDQFNIQFSDDEFDDAWCTMLARVPERRTRLLKSLSADYDLYILSNTSELHINKFSNMFLDAGGFPLSEIFSGCYYSHETGNHKPDEQAFIHVLKDAGIKAEETLFLDDNIQNIKSAKGLGFNVIHITENLKMENVGYDR
ncbi:MAG: HAD family phosphatase [Bacteroidales bacterium]|nr:HAD family phosphatase [Bacteroidales bacterium]